MLDHLHIGESDTVIEFAPGLGVTAKMVLQTNPWYIAIERDEKAAELISGYLNGVRQKCVRGTAEKTGLPNQSATVVYGEAMLTMQSPKQKERIVAEAQRLLKPGGRYAIHELALTPEDIDEGTKEAIRKDLVESIKVNARPLTVPEWKQLLENHGFQIESVETTPMHLLRSKRLIEDEGITGTLRILKNMILNPRAGKRVLHMRKTFIKYSRYLQGVCIIARLPEKGKLR